jgi:hypothetical protein
MSVGTAGGTVQGNLKFIERAAPTRNVVAILPGTDRALRGQYVAIGAHSDHVGYRATGPVDHDSLHLYAAQRFSRDGESERRAAHAGGATGQQARVAAIRVNLDSVRALRPARPRLDQQRRRRRRLGLDDGARGRAGVRSGDA